MCKNLALKIAMVLLWLGIYIPKNIIFKKLSAIAISDPFGAVKEQSSGFYAQTLAELGFVVLAFDPSFTGESGGNPKKCSKSRYEYRRL